jgi:group I intron endonuclease
MGFCGTVYRITNDINQKVYVGKTHAALAHRWGQHKSTARSGGKGCFFIHRAMRRHGVDHFAIEALQTDISTAKELNDAERWWITNQGSLCPGGYNFTDGGEGGAVHPDTRAKISKARMGHEVTIESRERIRIGKILSCADPAVRARMVEIGKHAKPEEVTRRLALLEAINSDPERPARCREEQIRYWADPASHEKQRQLQQARRKRERLSGKPQPRGANGRYLTQ